MPETALDSFTSPRFPFCLPCSIMARESGCSEPVSTVPARYAALPSSTGAFGSMMKSVTAGLPIVRVPVLSNTTAVSLYAVSSAAPPLRMMPNFAARPIPTTSAVGVARPIAHGHEMTRTAIMRMIEARMLRSPMKYQPTNVNAAKTTTAGTKYSEILSTKSCTGAREACASSTMRMI